MHQFRVFPLLAIYCKSHKQPHDRKIRGLIYLQQILTTSKKTNKQNKKTLKLFGFWIWSNYFLEELRMLIIFH